MKIISLDEYRRSHKLPKAIEAIPNKKKLTIQEISERL